jgi:hypothetical protein
MVYKASLLAGKNWSIHSGDDTYQQKKLGLCEKGQRLCGQPPAGHMASHKQQ